jgi:hypothetical protein
VFVWRYFNAQGGDAGGSAPFTERQAAEDWMGVAWSDLLSLGVEEAALVDEERDRTLYRMGLRAE